MTQREIKFRAKNKKGYWVYWTIQSAIQPSNMMEDGDLDWDTLGEFTGLLDKNGKEIWEGDIMSIPFTDIGNTKHPPEIVSIIWESPEFKFSNTGKVFGNIKYNVGEGKIIGNIYEKYEELKNDRGDDSAKYEGDK